MPFKPTLLHQVYNQALLSRRVMNQDVALVMYRRAIKACQAEDPDFRPLHTPDEAGLVKFVNDLNEIVEELGLEIRRSREDTEQGRYWIALVNTDATTEVSAKGTDYTPLEISFFRKVLEGIIDSYPANSVGSNQALRLTDELASSMTKSQGEHLLTTFVSRGWLARSKRGRYSLAPRGQMELEPWLRAERSEDIYKCQRCEKIVLTGVACGNERCESHYHLYCYHPIRAQRCRGCNTAFADHEVKPIGEAAVPRREDEWQAATRKRKRPSEAQRSDRAARDEEEEDGQDLESEGDEAPREEDEERETQATQSSQAVRPSASGRPGGRRTRGDQPGSREETPPYRIPKMHDSDWRNK